MVVAAQHVGDLHVDVVDHDGKVVQGRAIGAQNHEIADVLAFETDASVHRVVPRQLAGGDAQPDRVLLHVGLPLFQQLIGDLLVTGESSALEDGRLVPVEAEPGETVKNDLGVFIGGTGLVGVLDAKQKLSALAAGEQPVEQRCPGSSDVQVSRGGWCEPDSNRHRERRRGDSNPR